MGGDVGALTFIRLQGVVERLAAGLPAFFFFAASGRFDFLLRDDPFGVAFDGRVGRAAGYEAGGHCGLWWLVSW